MGSHALRFAAVAVAWLGCAPMASPTRPPGDQPLSSGASSPDPNAVLFPDASASEEASEGQGAEALDDARNSTEAFWSTPAGYTSWGSSGFNHAIDPWRHVQPPETPKDAERRRLRGSPADVHTPEGIARGYRVNRHYPDAPDAVAVIGTGTKDIPQMGWASYSLVRRPLEESEKAEKVFWAFLHAAQRVAAVSSIHGATVGRRCVDSGEDAVVFYLHDWRQVDLAIHNIGSWLAAHDWKGDVILSMQPIPGRVYPK
jgi:hypothetical protein